jgi:hypothetical protein
VTSTYPLLDRIAARKGERIGPVAPVPLTEKMSPFSRRLAEKRLHVSDLTVYNHDGCGPDGRSA